MLPVAGKPVIQYIVEAAAASGIEQIVLVTGANNKAVEDFFDTSFELEHQLEQTRKWELLSEIRRITELAELAYVRQKHPLGNGHAVLMARHVVGEEPFAVLWGDDILIGEPPVPRQLIAVAQELEGPVIGVRRVGPEDFEKYGMVVVEPIDGRTDVQRALSVVEKPKREDSPSDLAQIGGFVLTPDIFEILAHTPVGTSGEIFLADALILLMQQRTVYTYEFTGKRYDAGNKLDYLRANIELSLADPEIGPGLKAFLRTLELDTLVATP
jgi:UTP--glucose-1-phosphate uridylyltransferase